MPKYALIAVTAPADGMEAQYRDWYDTVHTPELLAIPGIAKSRRFRIKISNLPEAGRNQFIAIHDVETNDLNEVLTGLSQLAKPPACLDAAISRTIVAEEVFSSN